MKNSLFQKYFEILKIQVSVPVLFFCVAFITGVVIYKDYGMSWDELTNKTNGIYSYNYIFKNDNSLFSYQDKDYGVAIELPLVILEKIFGLKDPQDVFHMRHFVTFILFFISSIVFYFIGKSYLGDWKAGLLGSLFLFLSPRIFAHSFYNSKDLPFLSICIVCIYTLMKYLNTKSIRHAILHAFFCAILIDIRITGIFVPFITIFFLCMDFINHTHENKTDQIKSLSGFFAYVSTLLIFIYAFWPYLWPNPVHNFVQVFINMSHFRWDLPILYMGRYINQSMLPWHYIPVWLIITTPVMYVLNFLIGLLPCFKSAFSGKSVFSLNHRQKTDIMFLLFFFLPLVAVIAMKSALYDGWRHLYFIYPAFLMISLRGLLFVTGYSSPSVTTHRKRIIRYIFTVLMVLQTAHTVFFMIKHHPNQNLYFNFFAGTGMSSIQTRFEFDYWGLASRQALEYILNNDMGKTINVDSASPPVFYNSNIIPEQDRVRLHFVDDVKDARYYISNHRWHAEKHISKGLIQITEFDIRRMKKIVVTVNESDELFSVKIGDAKIVVVYKLQQ